MKIIIFLLLVAWLVSHTFHKPNILSHEQIKAKVEECFGENHIMVEVASCESSYTQWGKNGEVYRGEQNPKDVGVMQINTYHHGQEAMRLGYNLESLEGNLAYAKLLYEREGVKPWKSSARCWGKSAQAVSETSVAYSKRRKNNKKGPAPSKGGVSIPDVPVSILDQEVSDSAKIETKNLTENMVYLVNLGPSNVTEAEVDDSELKDTIMPGRIGRFSYEGSKEIILVANVHTSEGLFSKDVLGTKLREFRNGTWVVFFEDGKEPRRTQDLSELNELLKPEPTE